MFQAQQGHYVHFYRLSYQGSLTCILKNLLCTRTHEAGHSCGMYIKRIRASFWFQSTASCSKDLVLRVWNSVSTPIQSLLGGSVVKNLPANAGMRVLSLAREDLLEKEMATHSSVLAWKIPWTEEPGRLQSMGLQENQTQPSNWNNNWTTVSQHIPWAGCWSKPFLCINWIKVHRNFLQGLLMFPFFRWENQGTEGLSNLSTYPRSQSVNWVSTSGS